MAGSRLRQRRPRSDGGILRVMNLALASAVPETRIGYTSPAATYDRMRHMHATSIVPLDLAVRANLPESSPFRAAWESWLVRGWGPFFAGPHPELFPRAVAMVMSSDEVGMQAENFREQLEDFHRTYPLQKRADGTPVAAAGAAAPTLANLPLPPHVPALQIGLAVGAAGLVAFGATALYRRRQARAKTSRPR